MGLALNLYSHAWRNGYWRLMYGCEMVDWFGLERDAVAAAVYMNTNTPENAR